VLLVLTITLGNLSSGVEEYRYTVVKVYPHDPEAFTQGLVIYNGTLIESTGLYGRSSIRKVELTTGNLTEVFHLPEIYFGEGVTVHGNRILQVTWRSKVGFIYDMDLVVIGSFSIEMEGWGLTTDEESLILSNGTPTLYFLDPYTFQVTHSIPVMDGSGPVYNINELEYIDGRIYANIWNTDKIIIIDPTSGIVQALLDLSGLRDYVQDVEVNVLNGIAYHEGHLYLTGKLWPHLFKVIVHT
jgi:glutamine cyclotransferase